MRIDNEIKLDFDDVLIQPKRSSMPSRSKVELERSYTTLNSKQVIHGIPIIAANLDTVGTFAMAEALSKFGMFTSLHKFYSKEKLIKFYSEEIASEHCFYTLGIGEEDIKKLKSVQSSVKLINKIVVDVANGYTEFFQNKVKEIRELCPDSILVAGNVATPEMVQELLLSGAADIVKIGIGPGKFCTTRLVTGCGYPQLSAVIECADAAHGLGGHIIADGGCRYPGDVAKCFGAGADFVMLGGMFSGTDQCEGDWEEQYEITKDSVVTGKMVKKSLKAYGMSSKEAMEKHAGGVSSYRASEGRCIKVPYKGPVEDVVQQILGGLRSTCSYVGAVKLKDLCKCTTFIRCNKVHSNTEL